MEDQDVLDAGLHDLIEELDRLRSAGIDGSLRATTFDATKVRLEATCPAEHRPWLDQHLAEIEAEFAVHEGVCRTDTPAP